MKIKCQSCGALQDSNEGQNCQFCGGIISASTEINASIEKLNANGNLFKLAEVAFEGGNYDEAINYYNKCLEIDSDFFEVWYKKGLSILYTSTVGTLNSQQCISSLNQALKGSPERKSFAKRMKKDILPFIKKYYSVSIKHYMDFSNLDNSGIELANRINITNDALIFLMENCEMNNKQDLSILYDFIVEIHRIVALHRGKETGVILRAINKIKVNLENRLKSIDKNFKTNEQIIAPYLIGLFIGIILAIIIGLIIPKSLYKMTNGYLTYFIMFIFSVSGWYFGGKYNKK